MCLLYLLRCRQILYPLSYHGSPNVSYYRYISDSNPSLILNHFHCILSFIYFVPWIVSIFVAIVKSIWLFITPFYPNRLFLICRKYTYVTIRNLPKVYYFKQLSYWIPCFLGKQLHNTQAITIFFQFLSFISFS